MSGRRCGCSQVFQGLVLLGLIRRDYRPQDEAALGLPGARGHALQGREAPEFVANDIFGETISSDDFADKLRAFVFVSPDCRSCSLTLAEMEALEWKADGTVLVVCRSDREECRVLAETYGLREPVIIDEDLEVSKLFGISSVPAAVLVDENNRVSAFGEPMRGEELEEILRGGEEVKVLEAT